MAELTPETQRVWPPAHEQLRTGRWQPESLGVELEAWWLWVCARWGEVGPWGVGWEVGLAAGPWAGLAQARPALWAAPSALPWSPRG